MDDYNISVLSEAKNEYSLRLVSILCPLILEGLKIYFKEAWELCLSNNEEEKYLMTFQNFLSRVTKWNQTIIEEETTRIITKSDCPYLEDLLTCVHITQLKILTSIRVSQRQKKIELDIPKLSDFVHKVYIQCARKFYSTVYLFEQQIPPLQYQKNMRECETICRECILSVIRDNMPVEHIIRTYMDESIEEEFIEEDDGTDVSGAPVNTLDVSSVETAKIVIKKDGEIKKDITEEAKVSKEEPTEMKEEKELNKEQEEKEKEAAKKGTEEAAKKGTEEEAAIAGKEKEAAVEEENKEFVEDTKKNIKEEMDSVVEIATLPPPPPLQVESAAPAVFTEVETEPRHLSFTDVDKVFDGNKLSEITAPKDIDTLEKLSRKRNEQRKAEEAEEEEDNGLIKIHNDSDVDLDVLSLDEAEELDDSVFADIEQL